MVETFTILDSLNAQRMLALTVKNAFSLIELRTSVGGAGVTRDPYYVESSL